MSFLDTPVVGSTTLGEVILFCLVVVAILVMGRLFYILVRKRLDKKTGRGLSKSVARLVQYLIIIAGITVAFTYILHTQLTAFLVSLGIVTIAVAFASQQVVQNIIAGILVTVTRPIQIEDWVEFGGNLSTGLAKVSDLTLMYTVLRSTNGDIMYIPNSTLLTNKVINYSKAGFVALNIPIWVEGTESLAPFRELVLKEAESNPHIYPEVKGVEKPDLAKSLALNSIMAVMGPHVDMSKFNPLVTVIDIQLKKVRVLIKIWVREVDKRDQITSEFLEALRKGADQAGIVITEEP